MRSSATARSSAEPDLRTLLAASRAASASALAAAAYSRREVTSVWRPSRPRRACSASVRAAISSAAVSASRCSTAWRPAPVSERVAAISTETLSSLPSAEDEPVAEALHAGVDATRQLALDGVDAGGQRLHGGGIPALGALHRAAQRADVGLQPLQRGVRRGVRPDGSILQGLDGGVDGVQLGGDVGELGGERLDGLAGGVPHPAHQRARAGGGLAGGGGLLAGDGGLRQRGRDLLAGSGDGLVEAGDGGDGLGGVGTALAGVALSGAGECADLLDDRGLGGDLGERRLVGAVDHVGAVAGLAGQAARLLGVLLDAADVGAQAGQAGTRLLGDGLGGLDLRGQLVQAGPGGGQLVLAGGGDVGAALGRGALGERARLLRGPRGVAQLGLDLLTLGAQLLEVCAQLVVVAAQPLADLPGVVTVVVELVEAGLDPSAFLAQVRGLLAQFLGEEADGLEARAGLGDAGRRPARACGGPRRTGLCRTAGTPAGPGCGPSPPRAARRDAGRRRARRERPWRRRGRRTPAPHRGA